MKSCRIAFESSFTIEPISKYIKRACGKVGISPDLYFGPFNAYHQDILDDRSELYQFNPDIMIIFTRLEEVCPGLTQGFDPGNTYKYNECIEDTASRTDDLIVAFRKRSRAKILLSNFIISGNKSLSIFDSQIPNGQKFWVRSLNDRVLKAVKGYSDVYIFDLENVIGDIGRKQWIDPRMWAIAKMPLSSQSLEALANEYVRYFIPILGLSKKCLVLDLDNTLWGGIVGEDGFNGIKMDDKYPGIAYREFQEQILELYNKGIILAVNSKNNPDDAMEIIRNHPDMVLREKNFASMKINWSDKASNIREIATELNIGLDSLVYLDDNPAERDIVRTFIPEVLVPDMPIDPLDYKTFLCDLPVFENLNITSEDRERGEMYAAQVKRTSLQKTASSMEEFLKGLDMHLTIGPCNDYTRSRVAQLTQKTNQFNLTTRRYSEDEIANMAASDDYLVYYAHLTDRFGDNGITGVCIIKKAKEVWHIDTLLLSCRIMFRTVENAIIAYIVSKARENNIKAITGEFIATKKNMSTAQFYQIIGFAKVKDSDGRSIWCLDLNGTNIQSPDCFKLVIKE
jgi:FkbH-like protein